MTAIDVNARLQSPRIDVPWLRGGETRWNATRIYDGDGLFLADTHVVAMDEAYAGDEARAEHIVGLHNRWLSERAELDPPGRRALARVAGLASNGVNGDAWDALQSDVREVERRMRDTPPAVLGPLVHAPTETDTALRLLAHTVLDFELRGDRLTAGVILAAMRAMRVAYAARRGTLSGMDAVQKGLIDDLHADAP